jgi:hypothetical protein
VEIDVDSAILIMSGAEQDLTFSALENLKPKIPIGTAITQGSGATLVRGVTVSEISATDTQVTVRVFTATEAGFTGTAAKPVKTEFDVEFNVELDVEKKRG